MQVIDCKRITFIRHIKHLHEICHVKWSSHGNCSFGHKHKSIIQKATQVDIWVQEEVYKNESNNFKWNLTIETCKSRSFSMRNMNRAGIHVDATVWYKSGCFLLKNISNIIWKENNNYRGFWHELDACINHGSCVYLWLCPECKEVPVLFNKHKSSRFFLIATYGSLRCLAYQTQDACCTLIQSHFSSPTQDRSNPSSAVLCLSSSRLPLWGIYKYPPGRADVQQ